MYHSNTWFEKILKRAYGTGQISIKMEIICVHSASRVKPSSNQKFLGFYDTLFLFLLAMYVFIPFNDRLMEENLIFFCDPNIVPLPQRR